jgi:superfamily II DNA or RNA helicase
LITIEHTYIGDNGVIVFTAETMDEFGLCMRHLSGINGARSDGEGRWVLPEHKLPEARKASVEISKVAKIQADESIKSYGRHYDALLKPVDVVIECDAVMAFLRPNKSLPDGVEDEIDKATRYFFKGAVRDHRFKRGLWDGYIRLYNKRNKRFYTGLVHLVTPVLDKFKLTYEIINNYETSVPRQFEWIVNDGIQPDPDQIEAIAAGYNGKRGVLKAPTGFGKTAILAKNLVARFGVPTLFVANKIALLDDAASEFVKGMDGDPISVGEIKEGKFCGRTITKDMPPIEKIETPIVVATIQSLYKNLMNPVTKDVLGDWLANICKFIMVDECQAVGTSMWDAVLSRCLAPYRIMLSATPNRTDGGKIKIHAQSGPILFSTTAEAQIEKGRLCELDISYLVFDHGLYNESDNGVEYNNAAMEWIALNERRNMECVVNPTLKFVEEGRIVLVLVSLIAHGEELKRLFVENGVPESDVRFIHGSTKSEVRKESIREFRKGEFKILIGSTIFDAGVNIPAISAVVLAGAGNSEITLVQRIGRGARQADYENDFGYLPEFLTRNHGQKVTKVIDVMDMNVKFFTAQSFNRYKNAKAEFGSKRVHIVGSIDGTKRRRVAREKIKSDEAKTIQNDAMAPFLKNAINKNPRMGFEILDKLEVEALQAFEKK